MTDKPLGAYERHEEPDYADGGVAAALIEKEAESCPEDCDYRIAHGRLVKTYRETLRRAEKAEDRADEAHNLCVALRADLAAMEARAEQAEQERDEARANAYNWEATAGEWEKRALAAESRPLTPDAITDEMVNRVYDVLDDAEFNTFPSGAIAIRHLKDVSRKALTAALTEPPARSEGAEELGELIGTWTAAEDIAPAQLPTGSLATLADFLAEHGVRVVGGEQS